MSYPGRIATLDAQPVPSGWYTVCAAEALAPGGLHAFTLAAMALVAYRTVDGQACVVEDLCPHMGGRLSCGAVIGNALRCPVHHFAFAPDGQCIGTGMAEVSSKACLQPWPVLEINGLLLVYYHPQGRPPRTLPPACDWQGWTRQRVQTAEFDSTVQTVTEGIADKAHLATVHGYSAVCMDKPFFTEGETLTTGYSFNNSGSLPGAGWLARTVSRLWPLTVRVEFDYFACGLGYSLTEVRIPALGVCMRHFVNPTPLAPGRVRLFYTMALGPVEGGHPMLSWLPPRLRQAVLFPALYRGFRHDLDDDMALWTQLKPLAQPILCKADGPVHKFRQWAAQFYSEV